jgi:formylglycine-generating enzyme required for sulfatase activity
MRSASSIIAILLAAACLLGCGQNAPGAPPLDNDPAITEGPGVSLALPANRSLLGIYTIRISADRSSVEITPNRALALHLNAVRMLEVDPCSDCLSIEEINPLGEGRVEVTIQLKHPYSNDHKGLTGFDVRGIVMAPGSFEFPTAGVTAGREELGDLTLVGADGYTRLFNPEEFPEGKHQAPALNYIPGEFATPSLEAAILNPYLVFVPEEERNHFPAGATASRVYDLKLPAGPVEFGYAVDVNWVPVDGPVVNVPDDFPLSANSIEAYRVWVSIGKGLTPTGTGTARVMIEVFDWQGADTIEQVLTEAPDLFDGEVEASLSTVTDESAIYYGQIQNSKLAPIGDYPLLVTVKDKETDPNLGPVAAYQVITAHVTLTGVWIRELVLIPAGEFIMGGDPDFDPQVNPTVGETPQHVHPTGEYWIGRFEISSEEYAAFMADGGYFEPAYWSSEGWDWRLANDIVAPLGWNEWPEKTSHNGIAFPDYPTYHLAWFEAEAFCNWAGGRLPTEAEWEKAARGTDGRIWPWGNEWDGTKCQEHQFKPAPVGAHSPEGDSPYGVADTIGNAQEWCSDWMNYNAYDEYALGNFSPPSEPTYDGNRVIRGGTWCDNYAGGDLRTSARRGLPQDTQTSTGTIRIVYIS